MNINYSGKKFVKPFDFQFFVSNLKICSIPWTPNHPDFEIKHQNRLDFEIDSLFSTSKPTTSAFNSLFHHSKIEVDFFCFWLFRFQSSLNNKPMLLTTNFRSKYVQPIDLHLLQVFLFKIYQNQKQILWFLNNNLIIIDSINIQIISNRFISWIQQSKQINFRNDEKKTKMLEQVEENAIQ